MDLLPDLVLLEIFSFTGVEERFEKLRLVCKRWMQVVEVLIQKELVVCGNEQPLKNRWPSDNRPINSLSLVGNPFFDFYLANDHYNSVKRLFLCQINGPQFGLKGLTAKLLNCLGQLEELSIDQTKLEICGIVPPYVPLYVPGDKDLGFDLNGLTLPNLRVLIVKQEFRKKASITVPKLEKLVLWDLRFRFNQEKGLMIALSDPERLKHLQCQLIDKQIKAFPNLVQMSALNASLDFDLSHHRKLKQLDLCISYPTFLENSVNCHRTIEGLIEQKERLKFDDLEITNFGAKDDVAEERDGIENRCSKHFDFHPNCDLDSFVSNFTIDYMPWEIRYYFSPNPHKGFGQLCRSRLYIHSVTVEKADCFVKFDPNLLIQFLVEIGGVRRLCITKLPFAPFNSQDFFDLLPKVPYINILHFHGHPLLVTDFESLCSIRALKRVELSIDPSAFDSFYRAFKKCKIKQFWLRMQDIKYWWAALEVDLFVNRIVLRLLQGKHIEFKSLDAAFATLRKEIANPSIF